MRQSGFSKQYMYVHITYLAERRDYNFVNKLIHAFIIYGATIVALPLFDKIHY